MIEGIGGGDTTGGVTVEAAAFRAGGGATLSPPGDGIRDDRGKGDGENGSEQASREGCDGCAEDETDGRLERRDDRWAA